MINIYITFASVNVMYRDTLTIFNVSVKLFDWECRHTYNEDVINLKAFLKYMGLLVFIFN